MAPSPSRPDTPRRQDPIEVRAPQPLHDAIDRYAALVGTTRSSAVRDLLTRSLTAAGLWPPAPTASAAP